MTAQRSRFAVTRIKRPDDGTQALIVDASLPLAWWRGVHVHKYVGGTLSRLELFVLEAATTLGGIDAQELTMITGLPGHLLTPLVRRLLRDGALQAVEGGFVPSAVLAAQALATGQLREKRDVKVDLAYLPDTDEMVAVQGDLVSIDNRRLDPVGQVPVAAGIAEMQWSEFIGERIRSRRVAALSPDVFDIVPPSDDPQLLPSGFCPVYRCDARVSLDGPVTKTELTLKGTSLRKRRNEASEQRQATIVLQGADELAATWSAPAMLPQQPHERGEVWAAILGRPATDTPSIEQLDAITWQLRLTAASTQQLADAGRDLAQGLVLRIAASSFAAHVVVEMHATDAGARALLERDRILARAEWDAADLIEVEKELAYLAGNLPYELAALLHPVAVRDRAWKLKRYHLAYTLRRREDFRYA